jgi:undecaprenyl-diphosphatase
MWDLLIGIDKNIFFLINHLPHNLVADFFFSFLSGIGSLGIIWLIIVAALFLIEEIEDKICFASLILVVILSLFLCDFLIKNIVQRPRPSYVLNNVIEVGDTRRDFSFPSFHATVSFAAAYVLTLHHKKLKTQYYLLAILIAFSRIYLGKHFPSDILGGIMLGLSIGYFSNWIISKKITSHRFNIHHKILLKKKRK